MIKRHSSARAYGVLVHNGQVALVRSSNPKHQPPLWWLPGGGIDFGESPEETVAREFLEETGLQVGHATLLHVSSDTRQRDNHDQVHTVRIIYRVQLLGGELRHEVHGTTDHAAWYDVKKVGEINLADYARDALSRIYAEVASDSGSLND